MGALGNIEPGSYTIVNWFMYSAALSIVLLKIFVRFRQQKTLLWDDGFAIIGILCLTLMAILNHLQRDALYLFVAVQTGQPPAPQFNTLEKINHALTAALKEQFSFMVFFWTCLWSIKFSLLMFYRRLFLGVNGYLRWWWIVVGVCVITWIASIITNFVACLPFNTRFAINSGCSVNQAVILLWFATIIDVLSDILVMILPIRLLIGLRISTQQKIGIGAVFSLGLVVIIFSIVRLVETSRSISASHVNSNISLAMWSMIEAAVAIIVGCLPSLKTLFIRRTNSEYSTGMKSTTRTGTGKGPHIRLYDIELAAVRNDVTAVGCGSDDSLFKCGGITRTQEVSVTSSRRETIDVRK